MSKYDLQIFEIGVDGQAPIGPEPIDGWFGAGYSAEDHTIPAGVWEFGVQQRTVRTDYPGGVRPTEQVLGPAYTPFTLSGQWRDSYAGEGFANYEWKRFEEFVKRGNMARIIHGDVFFDGIITELTIRYQNEHEIGYSFTFSPHHREPGGFFSSQVVSRKTLNAKQLLAPVVNVYAQAVERHADAPRYAVSSDTFNDLDLKVGAWETTIADISNVIDQRALLPELEPKAALLRLASQFYSLATVADEIVTIANPLAAPADLVWHTGETEILFDYWLRGLAGLARTMMVYAQQAAADLQSRAAPDIIQLYRPKQGENMYSISNRYYGEHAGWRIIARRNGLNSFYMSGDEILLIPATTEVGGA